MQKNFQVWPLVPSRCQQRDLCNTETCRWPMGIEGTCGSCGLSAALSEDLLAQAGLWLWGTTLGPGLGSMHSLFYWFIRPHQGVNLWGAWTFPPEMQAPAHPTDHKLDCKGSGG